MRAHGTDLAALPLHPGDRGRGDRPPGHPACSVLEAAGVAGQGQSRAVAHQSGADPGVVGDRLEGDVLGNDGDEDGDPLVVVGDDAPDLDVAADGSFSSAPLSPGVRTFTYTVSNGTLSTTGTVIL